MATKEKKRAKLPPHVSLDPEKQKEFNQNTQKAKQKTAEGTAGPGVIYIGHLPHGFVEQPLRDFFKQFGKIKKLRLSRSKKTGNSKGYAFIQFAHDEVAKIAAETMNNYLMFNKLLTCTHMQNPHPDLFENADRPFYKPRGPVRAIRERNKPQSEMAVLSRVKKAEKMLEKKKKKLAELGINYSLEIKCDPVEVKEEQESDEESTDNTEEVQTVTTKQTKTRSKSSKLAPKVEHGNVEDDSDSEASLEDEVEEVKIEKEESNSDEELSPRQSKRKLKQTPKRQKLKVKHHSPALPVEEMKEKVPDEEASPRKSKRKMKETPRKAKVGMVKSPADVVEIKEEVDADVEPSPKQPKRKLKETPSSRKKVKKLK